MNSIYQLHGVLPGWATVEKRSWKCLHVLARAPMPSGALGRTYELVIRTTPRDTVEVSEGRHNAQLPKCCAERHINADATFCLHFGSTKPILDSDNAIDWWTSVGDFLKHQDYSSERRKWPIHAQLSHGDAAQAQLRMEELAEPLGWKEEILDSIFRGSGWLAGELPRRTKDKCGLVNVRTPCPRGCREKHHPYRKQACKRQHCIEGCKKQHSPILRVNCPYRTTVEELVLVEYSRRQREEKFIVYLRSVGVTCCETMDDCPLAN